MFCWVRTADSATAESHVTKNKNLNDMTPPSVDYGCTCSVAVDGDFALTIFGAVLYSEFAFIVL